MVLTSVCYVLCYSINAFSLPLDELQLISHGQVTAAVICNDQGEEGKHGSQDRCTVTKLRGHSKYQHGLHEYCSLMGH